jgi:hypothetical protein
MKVLEHLQGTGVITSPDGDVAAKYDVSITEDEPEGGQGTAPMAHFKHISGQVWSLHDPYFVATHFRKIMTLQMEDGRRFQFFHRDIDGSIGLKKWIG